MAATGFCIYALQKPLPVVVSYQWKDVNEAQTIKDEVSRKSIQSMTQISNFNRPQTYIVTHRNNRYKRFA